MLPVWPSALRGQRLIEYSKTDRPNGHDWLMVFGMEYENGVETVWRNSGRVRRHQWGQEETIEYSVQNLPPTATTRGVPKRMHIKIINGKRKGDMQEVVVEEKTTFFDGSVNITKEPMELVADPPSENFSEEETIEALKRVLDHGERPDEVFLGRAMDEQG